MYNVCIEEKGSMKRLRFNLLGGEKLGENGTKRIT